MGVGRLVLFTLTAKARAEPIMKFAELPVIRQEPAPPKAVHLEKGELVAKLTLY